MALKTIKIKELEKKLMKIREAAMFLGDMSELHKRAIKDMKRHLDELEFDKTFLEKQMEKAKESNRQIK